MSPAAQRTPREHLTVAAEAYATAMGRKFIDGSPTGPDAVGAWFIDRDDEQRQSYRLAERQADGSIRFPVETIALSARVLAIALDFARLAVGMERTGEPAHTLGYPYRGERGPAASREVIA